MLHLEVASSNVSIRRTSFPISDLILQDFEDWKMSSEEWVWPAMNKAAADKHLLGVKPMVDGA